MVASRTLMLVVLFIALPSVSFLLRPASLTATPVPKGRRPTAEEVRIKVFSSWYEDTSVLAGKPWPEHTVEPLGWKFGPDLVNSWQITGELATSPYTGGAKIDVSREPWQLDIYSQQVDGSMWVLPGIFKFEGDNVVWVTPPLNANWHRLDPNGHYPGRPKEFTSTKDNKYTWRLLKRCRYLQTQFPKEEKK